MKNNILTIQNPLDMPACIKKALGKIWKALPDNMSDICYTYGFICYSPRELSRDLIVHESVHARQQGSNPDEWWQKYGEDIPFRYSQELEAYKAQYKYICAQLGDRKAFFYAKRFASDMSAPMYGDMCNYQQALYDILRK